MNIWLSRYAKLLVVVTFLLVIAGGLVTSTGSGLAVPDWPLSYGQVMPPMVGGIRFEHTHRLIASFAGLMTLVFTVWMGVAEKRKWLRRLSIVALGAVVIQGILGGLTVLYLLPPPISILHACLAQTFFALVVSLAYFTSKEWVLADQIQSEKIVYLQNQLWLALIFIYSQLILGATLRHTKNSLVLISHIIGAFFVLAQIAAALVSTLKHFPSETKLTRPAVLLGLFAVTQFALGMGSFVFTKVLPETIQPSAAKVFFLTSHQTLGALVLAIAFFLMLRVYRARGASHGI